MKVIKKVVAALMVLGALAALTVLHASKLGRVHTLIMRMNAQEATERLMAYNPLLVDAVPLTLEEIFIYELGGADYAVKDIVL